MTKFSALRDACVLVPITKADTLLRLAEAGLYRPLWSDRILDEVTFAIEKIHPSLKADNKARHRATMMNEAFEDALVADWQELIACVDLPDGNDRHVVAAAIRGRADVIVTDNIKDFPRSRLSALGLSVQSGDEFLPNQLDLAPRLVIQALQRQSEATRNPALSVKEVLGRLEQTGAEQFVRAAHSQLWRLHDGC